MEKFIEGNWFKLSIVTISLMVGLSAIYYFVILLPKQQQRISNLQKNFDLQAQCADTAAKDFAKYFSDTTYGPGNSYQSHFNSQLNKCFIETYAPLSDGSVYIDLYDAVGQQHYAEFDGHENCNTLVLETTGEPNKCQLDSGNIWLDGNDTKTPADYHVGFQGVAIGPGVGDENTLKQFMEHIQPFMTN
jgi:hypothetical protein